jgi:4-hydroxy-tetrahydrodipicolinate reductase
MGAEVCRAVESARDLDLVAAIDLGDDRAPAETAEVIVDFTHPDVVMDNLF